MLDGSTDGTALKWPCSMFTADVPIGTLKQPPYLEARKRSLIMGHGLSTYTATTYRE